MIRPSPKTLLLGFVGVALAAQAIRPARTNPPVDPTRTIEARTTMTPAVKSILNRSCKDCHTNETAWPWYSNVAPVSWILISHVNEGRQHLSLSDWAAYDRERATRKLKEMCDQVRKGEMPMSSYVWGHPDAKLSDADVDSLCAWTEQAALRP